MQKTKNHQFRLFSANLLALKKQKNHLCRALFYFFHLFIQITFTLFELDRKIGKKNNSRQCSSGFLFLSLLVSAFCKEKKNIFYSNCSSDTFLQAAILTFTLSFFLNTLELLLQSTAHIEFLEKKWFCLLKITLLEGSANFSLLNTTVLNQLICAGSANYLLNYSTVAAQPHQPPCVWCHFGALPCLSMVFAAAAVFPFSPFF